MVAAKAGKLLEKAVSFKAAMVSICDSDTCGFYVYGKLVILLSGVIVRTCYMKFSPKFAQFTYL
jgi:hypothetical protein